jgi:LuxR family maltose regulon positive regulatory protein
MMDSKPSRLEQSSQVRQAELIRTKLYIPQPHANLVARPRLIGRLNEGVYRPLILLSAAAGFGKTTLLSTWVSELNMPAAWISLDERDNDETRFIQYFIEALETLEIGVGVDWASIISEAAPLRLENLFTRLINQIAEVAEDFVLILNDYHWINSEAIHTALAFFLEHIPPRMHLVIATRVDPPLPLSQLRARSQLVELRANDLRFTIGEACQFFYQTMGLDLNEEAVASLQSCTEGWIAGLQLAALSIREREKLDEFVVSFTGNHRYIVDYLAEQVLQQQPPEIQTFLLETSILERLSGSLCEAVTGREDGLEILEKLERANLFLVPLDDERQWYRYHHLFANFLQEQLRRTRPELWPVLHSKAAEWYESHCLIAEAVGHALAVGNTEQALRLVEQIAETIWMGGEMSRLLDWLEALPDAMVRSRPRLCIFHAWILNILGRTEETEARLFDAEQGLRRPAEELENRRTLQGMLSTTRAILAIMEGNVQRAIKLSRLALDDLPRQNLVWRSVVFRNLGNAYLLQGKTGQAIQAIREAIHLSHMANNIYMNLVSMYELAEMQIIQGELHQAAGTFQDALQLAEDRAAPGMVITGALHVGFGEVLRQWNDLEAGMRHLKLGIEYGQKNGSLGIQVCGYTRLGLLALALDDSEMATESFRKAAQLAPVHQRTSFLAHYDAQARLWGRQPDIAAAERWTRDRGLRADGDPSYMDEAAYLTLARILITQKRLDEALHLLENLSDSARKAGRRGRVLEILVLQSLAFRVHGQTSSALAVLRQALEIAEPEGTIRLFADEGTPMQELLVLGIERQFWSETRLIRYTHKLLGAFSKTSSSGSGFEVHPHLHSSLPALLEPLSERELEILHHVASGLSNRHVADKLVIGVGTVNWHVSRIYRKLGVHSRTQAIALARELKLLSS